MSDSADERVFTVFTPHPATASTTASATVVRIVVHPAPPDPGFHVEARITVPPAPAPIWTPPVEFHHAPIDLVITAAAAGALVAWHVRRASLDAYVRAVRG